jgi:hypothetical protein
MMPQQQLQEATPLLTPLLTCSSRTASSESNARAALPLL